MKRFTIVPITLLIASITLFASCSKDSSISTTLPTGDNTLLVMTADYLTNEFKGGAEMSFAKSSETFTLDTLYQGPADFGSLRFRYKELDTTIFYGTIIWTGKGEMQIPSQISPASSFEKLATSDYVFPKNGIQNIFDPSNAAHDYQTAWTNLQTVALVKQYINKYPDAKVKTFLYTPSIGVGNPADWYWVFFIKN